MEKAYDSYRVEEGLVIGRLEGFPESEIGPLGEIMDDYFTLRRLVNTGQLVKRRQDAALMADDERIRALVAGISDRHPEDQDGS